MGKKKATKTRKLRPIIEQAIRDGNIFISSRKKAKYNFGQPQFSIETEYVYDVSFVNDSDWFDDDSDAVPITVKVHDDGSINFWFIRDREHMMDRTGIAWLQRELEEIMVMHKLGAYCSKRKIKPGHHDAVHLFPAQPRKKKK